ncbi:ArsR family transcriptional regulator [Robbsia sp. Bb-Pol-6]|uniref:ArsR family transcriptional regulator n=1 Tax=Robbsia betulipollinis TaxID=2981849 RepID=A0ABT3ZHY8_9BURK|nr:ArsR family transcriptional regulator [Robbsia betulipollinis]MCY0386131.1 ArsR family transcriptional regulator [Robbsia betulipollinis]
MTAKETPDIAGSAPAPTPSFDAEAIDPLQVAVLLELWTAWQASPRQPWSLAKLAKRVGVPMSVLRRALTQLDSSGLVALSAPEAARATAALSATGCELCAQLLQT